VDFATVGGNLISECSKFLFPVSLLTLDSGLIGFQTPSGRNCDSDSGTSDHCAALLQLFDAGCECDLPHISFHIQRGESQVMFGRERRQQLLLNRPFRHEQIDLHRVLLPHPVCPCDALLKNGRIPRQIDIDYGIRRLEVEPRRARVGGEEHATGRIVLKLVHQLLPLFLRDGSV